jgi:hypothetical protein
MLLAGEDGLPHELRQTNQKFVDWQLKWLEEVLSSGLKSGELAFAAPAKEQASFIYSAIQGAHIVAKFRKDKNDFKNSMNSLLSQVKAK